MKKFFAVVALLSLTLLTTTSFAQLAIDKGTKFVNLGIGIGGYGYFNGSGLGFNAAADFGVAKNITVGGVAGYRGYGDGVSSFDIGARGSYHFNELLSVPEAVDLYAGLGISYFSLNYGSTYGVLTGSYSTTYIPIHIGGRYFFSDNLGGFAELGSSLATLKLGITFKLGGK